MALPTGARKKLGTHQTLDDRKGLERVTRVSIEASSQILAHTPDLVFAGSKPVREMAENPTLKREIGMALRSYQDAASYFPNQIFIGADSPRMLTEPGTPWWNDLGQVRDKGTFGLLFNQSEFLQAMRRVDSAQLLRIRDPSTPPKGRAQSEVVESLITGKEANDSAEEGIPIHGRDHELGTVSWGYPNDEALAPHVILENLATKASAALALRFLINSNSIDPLSIDFVISCSEEAVGDRYQRGGGNLGKAIAEAVGATSASGFDVKNFCAAPIPALVVASSMIHAGVVDRVAVVAGGSVPKLGMKFRGHLKHEMPILEDCLGGIAVLLSRDGSGPAIRHDAVGIHSIDAGSSNQQIFQQLLMDPLERSGLKVTDVDQFGTELHNPELTEPQGSGNVPLRNYRMIAAIAAQRNHINSDDIDAFLSNRCVAGFAPTQGHIASAICLLPHTLAKMESGSINRAQLVAKGSLFLGRMSTLSDGMSIMIER